MPTGELPRNMTLLVDRHLVGKIVPGMRITAVGIFSIMQASGCTAWDISRVGSEGKCFLGRFGWILAGPPVQLWR